MQFLSSFFFIRLVSVYVGHPYCSIDTTTAWNDYFADDIEFIANTPTQAESLLHSLEQAARNICLYVNAEKTEYMYFNRVQAISTLNVGPLKLVDNFTYLGSSVSSTESDVNMHQAMALSAINR